MNSVEFAYMTLVTPHVCTFIMAMNSRGTFGRCPNCGRIACVVEHPPLKAIVRKVLDSIPGVPPRDKFDWEGYYL
jgi:hypothetical protein